MKKKKKKLRNYRASSSSCNTGRIAFHGRLWSEPTYVCACDFNINNSLESVFHLSHLKWQISHLLSGFRKDSVPCWQQSYAATMAITNLLIIHRFLTIGRRESYRKTQKLFKKIRKSKNGKRSTAHLLWKRKQQQELGTELKEDTLKIHLVLITRREKNKEEEPEFTRKTLTGLCKVTTKMTVKWDLKLVY